MTSRGSPRIDVSQRAWAVEGNPIQKNPNGNQGQEAEKNTSKEAGREGSPFSKALLRRQQVGQRAKYRERARLSGRPKKALLPLSP